MKDIRYVLVVETDQDGMKKIAINQKWPAALFLLAQTAPPLLMFWLVLGRWNIGVGMIVGIPLIYSFVRIVKLVRARNFHLLLRPFLTVLVAGSVIGMGNYYSRESAKYVEQLARAMQEQCNRDGVCKLPPGEWKAASHSYPATFAIRTGGLVPMQVLLIFDEDTHDTDPARCGGCEHPTTSAFTSFHLERVLEDHGYDVYGGVGRPLKIPKDY